CLISEEFAGSPCSAARNSRRDQNYLASALVSEAGGDCIVFDNLTPRSQRTDLPRTGAGVLCVHNPVISIRALRPFNMKPERGRPIQCPVIVQRPNQNNRPFPQLRGNGCPGILNLESVSVSPGQRHEPAKDLH